MNKEITNTIQKYKDKLEKVLDFSFRFMEVCGTHTVSIFKSGLRSLFPENLHHVSGPGCPVCVTHASEISLGMELAESNNVILAIFGDMMRVPDHEGKTLKELRAKGAKIEICYSPLDSLKLALDNPDREVVFWGVGFETTIPTVGATILEAKRQNIKNFSVLCMHKLIPPALKYLIEAEDIQIHGFLLPGHVSTIIGVTPYEFLAREYNIPAVISGFEPIDIMLSLYMLVDMYTKNKPEIKNQYTRCVSYEGNKKAQGIIYEVFAPSVGYWRGIGEIENSGLKIVEKYSEYDAAHKFSLKLKDVKEPKGCRCGEVLQGKILPKQCPLFGKRCTPLSPVGPCMVSTEGSCAAYFKYDF